MGRRAISAGSSRRYAVVIDVEGPDGDPRALIAGVPVHPVSLGEAAECIVTFGAAGERLVVHLCNAYVLSLASRDPGYQEVLAAADLNLADGAAVAWTMRRLGLPVAGERPSGPDVFAEALARSQGQDVGHYLYGAAPATVERLASTIRQRWPDVRLVGTESPPFRPLRDEEYAALVARVRASGAGILWVATGTPRQDVLIDRLRHDLTVVLVPVGAAFDFVAGEKRRAPRWMRRSGLEWVHRLLTEPRRLWRRYLIGNLRFLLVARQARVTTGGTEGGPWRPGLDRSDRPDDTGAT